MQGNPEELIRNYSSPNLQGMKWQERAELEAMVINNSEETKIREELELDVLRDLEDEIKDGICRLALRLHRLYQHQNTRSTEVSITIKMEGGCKVEINETKNKKDELNESRLPQSSKISTRPFGRARSLRSETTSALTFVNKHGGVGDHVHAPKNGDFARQPVGDSRRERGQLNIGKSKRWKL